MLSARNDPEFDAAPFAIATVGQTNSRRREVILLNEQSLRLFQHLSGGSRRVSIYLRISFLLSVFLV